MICPSFGYWYDDPVRADLAAERKRGVFRLPMPADSVAFSQFAKAVACVNRQAVLIQGELYEANQGQLCHVQSSQAEVVFRMRRPDGSGGFNGPFAWLTDEDLALIGAEILDVPAIVEAR